MNTPINDGGPAFPHATEGEYSDPQTCTHWHPYLGMSLRDYFAGQTLAGLLTQPAEDEYGPKCFAEAAYEMADAMIEARKINTTSK